MSIMSKVMSHSSSVYEWLARASYDIENLQKGMKTHFHGFGSYQNHEMYFEKATTSLNSQKALCSFTRVYP